MNIFALHSNPRKAARWHADKHVVKMLLESVQMLYTAHWTTAFPFLLQFRAPIQLSKVQKRLPLPPSISYGKAPHQLKNPETRGYRPVHIHHPCTTWVRSSRENYLWLCRLAVALAEEHHHRWPASLPHSCEAHALWLLAHPPSLPTTPHPSSVERGLDGEVKNSPSLTQTHTRFAEAMPELYKKHNPIASYRAFYKGSKTDRGITKSYTNRHPPHWLATGQKAALSPSYLTTKTDHSVQESRS
jgi:hypothetical protein